MNKKRLLELSNHNKNVSRKIFQCFKQILKRGNFLKRNVSAKTRRYIEHPQSFPPLALSWVLYTCSLRGLGDGSDGGKMETTVHDNNKK